MRKIFTLILSAMLCCISIQPVFAEKSSENENLSCAVSLLKTIGIVDSSIDGILKDKISRAQFAVFAARIIGINEYASNSTRYYNDLPMNHWALNSINSLAEQGIVMQSEDKLFRPDEIISVTEAGVILLKLAGYGQYAEYRGGYPTGYSALVSETKIAGEVRSYSEMTVEDACIMIYNALRIGTYQIKGFTANSGLSGEIDKDSTMLSRYFDIYHDKDIVNAIDTVSLNGVIPGRNQAVVGTTIYDVEGELDLFEYLGMTVDIFYRQEKSADCGTIIQIYAKESYNNILEIDLKNIDAVDDDYRIQYHEENETSRTARIPKTAAIIRNRSAFDGSLLTLLNRKNGTIRLIAAKSAGSYDTVVVEAYQNHIVSYVDTEKEEIYFKDANEPIKLQSYDMGRVKILEADGSLLSVKDLKRDDLVSIFYSEVCPRVFRNTQTVQGIVTLVDLDEHYLMINDMRYDLDWDFKKNNEIFTRKSYLFGLDLRGQIACIKNGSTEGLIFGYLIGFTRDDGNIQDSLVLKIYNEQGILAKENCYEKVTIDGKRVNLDVAELLLDANQLIRYSTKSDGSVKEIDTINYNPADESRYSLHETVAKQSLVYNVARGFSNNKASYPNALLGNDTIVFCIPNDAQTASEKEFLITERSNFSVWDRKDVAAYKTDLTAPYEEVVVVYGGNSVSITQKTGIIMVESIEMGLNEDDEAVEILNAYSNGSKVSYTMAYGYSLKDQGIECGDIIRVARDSKGLVYDKEMVFDYSETKPSADCKLYLEDYMSEHRVMSGRVISKSGNVIRVGHTSVLAVDEVADISSTKILVCDPDNKKEKIRTGTIDDVLDYENTGEKCSVVVAYTYISRMDQLFIYK